MYNFFVHLVARGIEAIVIILFWEWLNGRLG